MFVGKGVLIDFHFGSVLRGHGAQPVHERAAGVDGGGGGARRRLPGAARGPVERPDASAPAGLHRARHRRVRVGRRRGQGPRPGPLEDEHHVPSAAPQALSALPGNSFRSEWSM